MIWCIAVLTIWECFCWWKVTCGGFCRLTWRMNVLLYLKIQGGSMLVLFEVNTLTALVDVQLHVQISDIKKMPSNINSIVEQYIISPKTPLASTINILQIQKQLPSKSKTRLRYNLLSRDETNLGISSKETVVRRFSSCRH